MGRTYGHSLRTAFAEASTNGSAVPESRARSASHNGVTLADRDVWGSCPTGLITTDGTVDDGLLNHRRRRVLAEIYTPGVSFPQKPTLRL